RIRADPADADPVVGELRPLGEELLELLQDLLLCGVELLRVGGRAAARASRAAGTPRTWWRVLGRALLDVRVGHEFGDHSEPGGGAADLHDRVGVVGVDHVYVAAAAAGADGRRVGADIL